MTQGEPRDMFVLPTIVGYAPPGERSPLVNSNGHPQELQDIRLLVQNGNETIQILLKGQVIVKNSSPPRNHNGGDVAGQGTATAEQDADADKYLDNMRGWVMTVATLFVGMAYQGATQPPAWMPSAKDAFDVVFLGKDDDTANRELAQRALAHMILSAIIFAVSLTLVAWMPMMNKATPRSTWQRVTVMVVVLAVAVALVLSNAISEETNVGEIVCSIIIVYATATIWFDSWVRGLRNVVSWLCAPLQPAGGIRSRLLDLRQIIAN